MPMFFTEQAFILFTKYILFILFIIVMAGFLKWARYKFFTEWTNLFRWRRAFSATQNQMTGRISSARWTPEPTANCAWMAGEHFHGRNQASFQRKRTRLVLGFSWTSLYSGVNLILVCNQIFCYRYN